MFCTMASLFDATIGTAAAQTPPAPGAQPPLRRDPAATPPPAQGQPARPPAAAQPAQGGTRPATTQAPAKPAQPAAPAATPRPGQGAPGQAAPGQGTPVQATPPAAAQGPAGGAKPGTPAQAGRGEAPGAGDPPAKAVPPTSSPIPNFWDPKRRPERPAGEAGTIRFLTSGDFPPFNFLDSSGRLTGFNVDLARAICTEIDATCTIQMRPFEELTQALGERRGDAIIAGLVIGPAQRARLETSDVYLTAPGRFVAPKGSALTATPEGLELRWISVVSGSAHEAYVLDNFPRSRVVAYPNQAAARDALRDGTVDVHFGDAIGLSFWISGEASHGCCAFRGQPYLDRNYFGDGFRIAIAKGNKRLKQYLDYALQKLSEDGTVAELYFRYFPLGYY